MANGGIRVERASAACDRSFVTEMRGARENLVAPSSRRGASCGARSVLAAVLSLSSALPAAALDYSWVGARPSSPNWDLIEKWSTQVVPPNNGAHTAVLSATTGRSDPTLNLDWQLLGLRFASTTSHLVMSSGGTPSVGAGGIINENVGGS